jgi:hypothetical protein
MKYKLICWIFFSLLSASLMAQQDKAIRIADTLTAQEKSNRSTVLLKSELDSLIRVYNANQPRLQPQEPVIRTENNVPEYLLWVIIALSAGIALMLFFLFRNQQKFNETIFLLNRQVQNLELAAYSINNTDMSIIKSKGKPSVPVLEKKVQSLTTQLEKTLKDKEELQRLLEEYTDSKLDFESVKQQMMEVYKIRNYPGFSKEKSETDIVRSLLDTERSVALYAYEHFLKPVLVIADANKNNPAKINPEEREKMLNLLISLSLLYSEYLYLRIGDLSVGGKIVERLGSLRNGDHIDTGLLKELNIEHGSRALVLRMVLDKMDIQNLSYPVFDETNLNLS